MRVLNLAEGLEYRLIHGGQFSVLGTDCTHGYEPHTDYIHMDECIPDFTDPATLGCLLGLVRAKGGSETIATRRLSDMGHHMAIHTHGPRKGKSVKINGWGVYGLTCSADLPVGDTEIEALVVALEMIGVCR